MWGSRRLRKASAGGENALRGAVNRYGASSGSLAKAAWPENFASGRPLREQPPGNA